MSTVQTQIAISIFYCQKIKDRNYPSGIHYLEWLVYKKSGIKYPMFENSKLLRGQHKGEIKFKQTSDDYTTEHHRRKVKYKFGSGSSKIGHLTKMTPLGNGKYHGDVKGTNDKLLFQSKNDKMAIIVIPDAKHDYSLVDDFMDGLFDDEIGL